jgi:serine/threonine-protein kinase
VLPLKDLKPGDTLGRYEILMPVARGGMATVWAARLTGSRGFTKLVAIKTMLPGLSDDPDFEAMFLDEARLAAKIRHPHVVEIIDLGDQDEWIYIVMEWVNGETMFTLNKRAKAKGGIPLPLMLRIASAACAGLHAAHELRDEKGNLLDLVHRDISPQNVMVSFDGIVKLVDFGVAKAAGRMHETRVAGIMKGKVPYLSPEQLMGQKVDRRSDLFSLGVLMYVMVSGRHPFRGESDSKTMENICTRAPVPLRDLVANVRPDLESIVMRALDKERDERWSTAAEMQRALDQVLVNLGESVTDGDVAKFVRDVLGDLIVERNQQLESSIERMDARGASSDRPVPGSTRLSAKRAVKGGAPLPATFDGILPVALEDAGPYEPPRREAPPSVPSLPPSKRSSSRPPQRARSRTSMLPLATLGMVVLVAGAAAGVRTGNLPWLAERLPPWLEMLAPPAPAATPPPIAETPPPPPPAPPPDPAPPTPAATSAPVRPPPAPAPAPPPAPAPAAPQGTTTMPPSPPPTATAPKKVTPKPTATGATTSTPTGTAPAKPFAPPTL